MSTGILAEVRSYLHTLTRSQRPLHVVAFGDSVPAAAVTTAEGYVDLVGDAVGESHLAGVVVENEAVSGSTTADVLSLLEDEDIRSEVSSADVVIVQIGANDLDEEHAWADECLTIDCYVNERQMAHERLSEALDQINAVRPRQSAVVVIGYWNVFLDGSLATAEGDTYVRVSTKATNDLNGMLRDLAATKDAAYVDLFEPFTTDSEHSMDDLLEYDGDHPSGAGHQLIAREVVKTIEDQLS